MEMGDEFSIEVISKSLNDIQGEKGRNERLLQTENTRRVNSEFELQTIIHNRKEAEKKYVDSVKKLATLKTKCTALDRQYEEAMKEHNGHRREIEAMKSEEKKNDGEHKYTMGVNYKILDEVVAKFRNTKLVMMNEIEDGDYNEVERELRLLEGEYGEQTSALDRVGYNNSIYDSRLKKYLMEESVLKDDHANLQVLNGYFREEMENAGRLLED